MLYYIYSIYTRYYTPTQYYTFVVLEISRVPACSIHYLVIILRELQRNYENIFIEYQV